MSMQEITVSTCRHVYSTVQKYFDSKKGGRLVSDFSKLLELDCFYMDEEPEVPSI